MMEEHYEKENPIILEILNYFLNNSKIRIKLKRVRLHIKTILQHFYKLLMWLILIDSHQLLTLIELFLLNHLLY